MRRTFSRTAIGLVAAAFALVVTGGIIAPVAAAEPGVSDTELIIGGDHPFSGPASAYGNIGKGIGAYFDYVNDHGGVYGRKIKWIDLDDGYSPPQAVQDVHQLVEQDHAFAIFDSLGTEVNTAIRPYLNQNGVPQVFVATGATKFGTDYKQFPWTIGWQPNYQAEAIIYGQDIVREHPHAKIGILFQNDDYGNDLITGLKRGLGSHTNLIAKTASYETSDASMSSQVASLKAAGCDTYVIFATPKFAIQGMIEAAKQGWHPLTYLNNVANAIPYMRIVSKVAGPSAVNGIITTIYLKDPANHARYAGDAGMKLYQEIMGKYLPGADQDDGNYLYGISIAYTFVDCLRKAGKNLTRAKLMDAVTHLDEPNNPLAYPGVVIRTSPTFRFPITQMITAKWLGTDWSPSGVLVDTRSYPITAQQ
jgi:branched-chain amino acid transport system substrate-binding protein